MQSHNSIQSFLRLFLSGVSVASLFFLSLFIEKSKRSMYICTPFYTFLIHFAVAGGGVLRWSSFFFIDYENNNT